MTFAELAEHLFDGETFVRSCRDYKANVNAPLIIASIAGIFTVIAGLDYINNNKYGYGNKYTEAWETLAPMAISMVGITSLTPVMRIFLTPFLGPVFRLLRSHQTMFAGCLLDPATGGFPLAVKLAPESYPLAMYSVILGSMLGATICFNIPVGLGMIQDENSIFFAYGTLVGILTVPFGCVVGGLAMSLTPFKLPVQATLENLIPIFIITVFLSFSLYFFPFGTLRGFMHFSGAINFLMTFGAIVAIFQEQTSIKFPLWGTMIDDEGDNQLLTILSVVSEIAMVLTGTIPMVHFVTSMIGPCLARVASKIGLKEIDAAGLVAALPSALPMFGLFDQMTNKGMVFNAAFEVGSAYALGDHLAYLGSVERGMIVPLIIAKLFAGSLSIVLCVFTADFFVRKALESRGDSLPEPDPHQAQGVATPQVDEIDMNGDLLTLSDL
jgi:ethanolamine transporter